MTDSKGKSPSKSESKIEADEIAKHVESFSAMGLEQDAVIEALHLIGPSRLDRVTEFLFSAPERQDAVRHTEFERKLRLLDEAHKKEMDEMSNEFESKKRTLIATAYGHFLRTSLCDGLVSEETVERLREMQSSARFSQSQHTKALQDIGLSVQAVEDMQELASIVASKLEVLSECSGCGTTPADHVVLSCLHLCLCAKCAAGVKKGATCPRCRRKMAGAPRKVFGGAAS